VGAERARLKERVEKMKRRLQTQERRVAEVVQMGEAEVRAVRARESVVMFEAGRKAGRKGEVVRRRPVGREDRKVRFDQVYAMIEGQVGEYLNVQQRMRVSSLNIKMYKMSQRQIVSTIISSS
jgi:hypothetical protein